MSKQKTHKGAAKRFKITGSGKVVRHHASKRHILTKKTRKRKRHLRHGVLVDIADVKGVRRMLGIGSGGQK